MSHEYAVFAYTHYDAAGGWSDLVGIFETIEEAMAKGKDACRRPRDRSAHIVHLQQRRIIVEGEWRHIRSTLTGQPGAEFFEWTAADESERKG